MEKVKKNRKRLVVGLLSVGLMMGNAGLFPSKASGQAPDTPISNVAYSGYDRDQILEVGGEPFFFNGVQIRVDKLKDGWNYSDEQIKDMFRLAKDDGFTVANAQIRWTDIQPDVGFKAEETAYIAGGENADKNFSAGSIQTAYDKHNPSNQSLSYMKFDLSAMPEGDIDGAKIRIYVSGTGRTDNDTQEMYYSHTLKVYGLEDDSWSAAKLTWNNAPGHEGYEVKGEGVHEAAISPSYDLVKKLFYYDFDVTEFVKNYCGADKKASFIFQSATPEDKGPEVPVVMDGKADLHAPELLISSKDRYDWSYLDKIISYAEEAGIKLEVLWFGTETCSLSIDMRVPFYVFHNYQKSMVNDTKPFLEKASTPSTTGVYRYLMCKNDFELREKEHEVVKAMFDHIAQYNEKTGGQKTVIGCEVANEPAVGMVHGNAIWENGKRIQHCMCENCKNLKKQMGLDDQGFRDWTMWGYTENIALAVKESDYPVWTRVNNFNATDAEGVEYNEWKRATTGTHVDFIGVDPYFLKDSKTYMYEMGHKSLYSRGSNLPMVMEYYGKSSDSVKMTLAALSGGSYYNIYDLGSSDNWGTYDNGPDNTPVPHGSYVEEIRNMNHMLNKIAYDLATKKPDEAGGTKLKYFNGQSKNETTNETKTIRNISVNYQNQSNGVGIAVEKSSREIALESTVPATFSLKGLAVYGIASVEEGYYDGQTWVKTGTPAYDVDKDVVIDIPAYGCVRVTTEAQLGKVQPQTEKYESEILSYTVSNERKIEVWDDGASGGGWMKVHTKQVGDYIEFTVNVPVGAEYEIMTGYRSGGTRGKAQLAVNGKAQGSQLDMYDSSTNYKEVSSGKVKIDGQTRFRYTISGKNPSSGDYEMGIDYIKLIPQTAKADKTELSAVVESAKTEADKSETYTQESINALILAIREACDVAESDFSTQEEVNQAYDVLLKRKEELVPVKKEEEPPKEEKPPKQEEELPKEDGGLQEENGKLPVVAVKSVKLNKKSLTLGVGEKFTLKASVSPQNATDKKVTWKLSNNKKVITIKNGKLVAKKKGSATVTAIVGGKKASCKVIVKKAPDKTARVMLNRKRITLKVRKTYQINAKVTNKYASNSFKYSVDKKGRKIVSVDKGGKVTAKKKGRATITVKAYNGKGKSAKVKVTVKK